MNGWVEKVKLVGCELAEVSKLPDEEAMEREEREREREREQTQQRENKRFLWL